MADSVQALRSRLNGLYVRGRRQIWAARARMNEECTSVRRRIYERLGSERYSRLADHGLDAVLGERLPSRPGTFVEVGAYDGTFMSNTYYLERFRGWSGVLIEPLPERYRRCVRARPNSQVFNCALVADEGQDSVVLRCEGPMSTVASIPMREVEPAVAETWGLNDLREIAVPARTMTSVLDEAGTVFIDLLSLDVEGFEAEVLQGLDFERFKPTWILVEFGRDRQRQAGVETALPAGYECLGEVSPLDVLYVWGSEEPSSPGIRLR